MDKSQFAYRANLEAAREAMLNSTGTVHQALSASEQVTSSANGLMRPRARPTEAEGSVASGFGLGLMESMQPKQPDASMRPQARPTYAPETSPRPRSRAQGQAASAVQEELFQGMLDRGLPEHVAVGFMSNFSDESGFDIDITEGEANVHGTFGRGVYQTTGSRRTEYESRFGNDWSVDNQLDYMMWELNNTESRAYDRIMDTGTAGEAADAIVRSFLRPAAEHRDSRSAKYLDGSGLWNS